MSKRTRRETTLRTSTDRETGAQAVCILGCGAWRVGVDPCPCTPERHAEVVARDLARGYWLAAQRGAESLSIPPRHQAQVMGTLAEESRRVGWERTPPAIRCLLGEHR